MAATNHTTRLIATPNSNGHNILTIPLELFENIADKADRNDIFTIRLLCKEAKDKVQRTFLKTWFTKRVILLSSPMNLENLKSVAEQDLYAQVVKKLVFVVQEVEAETHKCDEWHGIPQSRCDLTVRECIEARGKDWRTYLEFLRGQQDLRQPSEVLRSLLYIFARLRKFGQTLEIEVGDTLDETPILMTRYHQETGREMYKIDHDPSPIDDVLEALASTGLRVRSFRVLLDMWEWSPSSLVCTDTKKWFTREVFSSLKELKLHFNSGVGTAPEVVDAVASASRVESLSLGYWWATEQEDEEWTVDSMIVHGILQKHFSDLKHLRLGGVHVVFKHLVDFCKRHEFLQSIELDNVDFLDIRLIDYGVKCDEQSARKIEKWVEKLLGSETGMRTKFWNVSGVLEEGFSRRRWIVES